MIRARSVFVILLGIVFSSDEVTATKLPDVLVMDDASREILFLDLYKRVSALEARTQMSDALDWTQQTQFDKLKSLAENQQTWLNDLEMLLKSNDKCEALKPNKIVAFSAYLSHDIEVGSRTNYVIVFNEVILNEGGCYDQTTGIFTCPLDGIYDISFFLGQRADDRDAKGVWANLLVNNEKVAMAVVDSFSQSQDLQGGNRVIIRLKTGDKVKVAAVGPGSHIEGTSHTASTFSAVFLFH